MQNQIDTESYARQQLMNRISKLKADNANLKSQLQGDDEMIHQSTLRNAKHVLTDILERQKAHNHITQYQIITTSNIAVKHPAFNIARPFDYIVITDAGIFNVDVKNWKQKTFYHFDVDAEKPMLHPEAHNLEQIVGQYIASRYHEQHSTAKQRTYTFIERIKNHRIVYDFYDYDPYQKASASSKAIKDHLEQKFNHKVQSIGLVYFNDGSVNLIDGPMVREKYTMTVSSKNSLENTIASTIKNAKHPFTEAQFNEIVAAFSNS